MKKVRFEKKLPSAIWPICGVGFFAIIFIYQIIRWYLYAKQEIALVPAVAFDQINYLTEVYHSYFVGQANGFWAGLSDFFKAAPGQGFALQFVTLLSLQLLPFGRASALLINVILFAVLCAVMLATFKPRARFGFAALLLAYLISLKTLYRLSGGLMDFRLDFAGLVVLSLTCLAIWRSDFFTKPRYCVLAGLLLILLCCTRFIMVIEMAGVLLVFTALLSIIFFTKRQWLQQADLQLANIFQGVGLTIGIAAFGIIPHLLIFWQSLYGYYVGGHVQGAEPAIRMHEAGINSLWDSLRFYPYESFAGQLGTVSMVLLYAVGLAAVICWWRLRRNPVFWAAMPFRRVLWAACFIIVLWLGCYSVLTLDTAKSIVTANVLLVPLTALYIACLYICITAFVVMANPQLYRIWQWAGGLLLAFALILQAARLSHSPFKHFRPEYGAGRNELTRVLAAAAQQHHWQQPHLFINHNGDHDAAALNFTAMELTQQSLGLQSVLTQIFAVNPAELWLQLATAHFIILVEPTVSSEPAVYPYDRQMDALAPQLAEFCRKNGVLLFEYQYYDYHISLYANRLVADGG